MDGHPPVPGEGPDDRIPPIDRLTVTNPLTSTFTRCPARSGPARAQTMAQTDYPRPHSAPIGQRSRPGGSRRHPPPWLGEPRPVGAVDGPCPVGHPRPAVPEVAACGNVALIVWNALVIADCRPGRCARPCRTQEEVRPAWLSKVLWTCLPAPQDDGVFGYASPRGSLQGLSCVRLGATLRRDLVHDDPLQMSYVPIPRRSSTGT